VRVGEVRLESDGLVAAGEGLIRPLQHHEHGPEIGMNRGRLRVEQQRRLEEARRGFVVTAVMFAESEKMQRIEVVWTLFQDLFVSGPRIGKLTQPVQCQRPSDHAGGIETLLGYGRRAENPLSFQAHLMFSCRGESVPGNQPGPAGKGSVAGASLDESPKQTVNHVSDVHAVTRTI
jgi:hypothetical protein